MMTMLRDLVKMEYFVQGSNVNLKNDGRITMYHNTGKNKPMWFFKWMFEFM